jgi:hypothetical protein
MIFGQRLAIIIHNQTERLAIVSCVDEYSKPNNNGMMYRRQLKIHSHASNCTFAFLKGRINNSKTTCLSFKHLDILFIRTRNNNNAEIFNLFNLIKSITFGKTFSRHQPACQIDSKHNSQFFPMFCAQSAI